MTILAFIAFAFGRTVFTLRNAGLVFAALVLLSPHYLLEPGFQMSFSAIFGMIWFFGDKKYEKTGRLQKLLAAPKILIQTSVVCTIFTAPFVAYHFHSLPIYGLLGNLLCLPIFSILIMPLVMLGQVGWAGAVYNWTLKIADWISSLPFAQVQIPIVSGLALCLMIAGLLSLMFIEHKKWKFGAAALCLAVSSLLIATQPRPLFYATLDHKLIAVVGEDGKLRFNQSSASDHFFAFDSWKQSNFEPVGTANPRIKCESGVCFIKTKNWSLVYMQKFVPLMKNIENLCEPSAAPDFIVSYFRVSAPGCAAKIPSGGFVIYESGRVREVRHSRIWHINRERSELR
jgi:competence protein ComEC